MNIRTIEWRSNAIRIIDQTKLPTKLEYLIIREVKALWQAIKLLKVRGAPALGAAAALGVYIGIKGSKAKSFAQFKKELDAGSSARAQLRCATPMPLSAKSRKLFLPRQGRLSKRTAPCVGA
jgi:methylthioribose-1-phosphate isomerase